MSVVLPAHRVATPVLDRVRGTVGGTVLGASATAAWVDLGGFALAVTTHEVPLLPNAVALTAGAGALDRVAPGAAASCSPASFVIPYGDSGRGRASSLVGYDSASP